MVTRLKTWHIAGRQFVAPPADWRAELAARLGERPRRIGAWAELALWGARRCLDAAGETQLPAGALLTVSSLHGPDRALRTALEQARLDTPLPIAFLASQASQVLPALAHALGWSGNGRCLTSRDPVATLHLACLEAGSSGLLAGWVDEDAAGTSLWLRLVPAADVPPGLRPADFGELAAPDATRLAFEAGRLLLAP